MSPLGSGDQAPPPMAVSSHPFPLAFSFLLLVLTLWEMVTGNSPHPKLLLLLLLLMSSAPSIHSKHRHPPFTALGCWPPCQGLSRRPASLHGPFLRGLSSCTVRLVFALLCFWRFGPLAIQDEPSAYSFVQRRTRVMGCPGSASGANPRVEHRAPSHQACAPASALSPWRL